MDMIVSLTIAICCFAGEVKDRIKCNKRIQQLVKHLEGLIEDYKVASKHVSVKRPSPTVGDLLCEGSTWFACLPRSHKQGRVHVIETG